MKKILLLIIGLSYASFLGAQTDIESNSEVENAKVELLSDSDKLPSNIYPNPTSNYFKIKDDKKVKHIVILNVLGKFISKSDHKTGMQHDISSLDKGLYLVRLIGEKDALLNVMRLTKE